MPDFCGNIACLMILGSEYGYLETLFCIEVQLLTCLFTPKTLKNGFSETKKKRKGLELVYILSS